MPCTKPRNPVRSVTTSSNLPVKPTGREGRRITGYLIFPKDLLRTPTRSARMRVAQSKKLYSTFPANGSYLETAEPYEPCTVLVLQGSDEGLTPHRRPHARRSPLHLGKRTTWWLSSRQRHLLSRATQAPEGSKRRRMRTASPGGRGNWSVALATPTINHNGQIVFPAGMEREGPLLVGTAATGSPRWYLYSIG
jgi:hypothetical protein